VSDETTTPEAGVELDTGYAAAAMYILEVARQVTGARVEVVVIPDPDGKNPMGKPGIYVEVRSLLFQDIAGSMLVAYNLDSLDGVRHALCTITLRILEAEEQKQAETEATSYTNDGGLIIPKKQLIVPK